MKTCFRVYIAILTTVFFLFPIPSLFAQGDGTALQFNGSNYVQIPKTSQWDLGQSSFTLAAWFKTSMSGGYGNIIRYDGPTSGSLYLVRINPGNQIEFLLAGGGRASVALATPLTYTDNQWHHVAAVRDSANDIMKIFIDGNLVASVAGQGKNIIGSSDANLAIGATAWGVEYFAGSIDEVSLWNVARTETEIRETMYHQPTGNEIGLIGNWRFDEGTGTTASDISSNHNTGTLINGPLWVPSTPSGSGTSGDPYLIATFDNLNWIAEDAARWNKVYKQTADIDASSTSTWEAGAGYLPIGDGTTAFSGSYDGQTYRITHLFINRGTTDNIGLFGNVSGATITNVNLDSVKITGNNNVGGLIGQQSTSIAANCKSAGSVTGAGTNIGGLIGNQLNGSTAKNCKNAGCVTGSGTNVGGLIGQESSSNDSTCCSVGSVNVNVNGQNAGGLIGNQYYSTATNCYSTDTVRSTGQTAGGLFASQIYSTATNCYSTGFVTGNGNVGGLIGYLYGSTAANCFWDVQTSGQASSAGGTGKSTADMKDYLTFSVRGWPLKGINCTIWNMGNGRNNGYPYLDWQYPGDPALAAPAQPSGSGTSGDPYLIATLSDLNWIIQDASRWSMVYKQIANIDATSSSSLNGGAGYLPIGDATTAFSGSYDGQTYKIIHLFINRGTTDNIGLFGYVSGATITNVKLDSVKITGNNNVGGLIGTQQNNSSVANCFSAGSVTGAGNNVGGLIGTQQNTSIAANCKSAGSVTGAGTNVGGLIGYQYNGSTARNCKNAGCVTGSINVGGLIGQENNSNDSTCYSVGSVNGSGQNAGGLIGTQYGSTAANCYSTDTVKGSAQNAGGLIANQVYSTATNCYSAGPVTGAGSIGGLIGYVYSSSDVNCFWDVQTSGQTGSTLGTGKNTADMKNYLTFSVRGWPLKGINGTIWNIGNSRNNGYPYLDWQYPGDPALAAPAQPSGSGTSGDPYLIATLSDLNWIIQDASRWSMVYKQIANIDATSSSSLNGGAGYLPIGDATTAFSGSYDGQTYKIIHLFINRGTTDNIGLFGYVSGATITNVKLDSVKITGNNNVGGLIGTQQNNSSVANCFSAGSVTGAGNNVGGLIGTQQNTSIAANCKSAGSVTGAGTNVGGLIGYQYNGSTARNCKNAGCVTGSINVGGLIGQENNSNDSTCYSVGSVNGSGQNAGGLIGTQYGSTAANCYSTDTVKGSAQNAGGLIANQVYSTATNCYSAGPVTGAGSIGGLIGYVYSSSDVNCFWDVQTSGQTGSTLGTGKNTADMKNYLTFSVRGWPLKGINGTIWNIGNSRNNGYPYLDWQYPGDPALAAPAQPSGSGTSGDPYLIATLSDLNWIIQDASRWSMVYKQIANIDATSSSSLNGGAGYLPIGDATTAFSGSYDGQMYKITGLFINRSGNDNIGLFGLVSGAVIKNVKLENIHITGNNNVGGLIGIQQNTSTATNCTSSGSVTGSGQYVGGLIGIQQNTSMATNCTSSDTVTGAGSVGGLIGYQYNGSTDSTCCSSGTVMGSGQFIGGLIGQQYSSTAANCYSTDSVTGSGQYVGGLVGYQYYGTVANCYSAGFVTGASVVGGLIGGQSSSAAANCFWDTTSSGQQSSAGGTGKSTVEMKSYLTFTGWSFKGIGGGALWNIGYGRNNGYPYFDWQYPGDISIAGASVQPSEGDGSSGNPYKIAILGNIIWVAQDTARWNKVYKQTANIDATISSSLDGSAGFPPIGDVTRPFTGSYDGQTYKITGLFISRSTKDNIGLFGNISSATIKNVKLANVQITGSNYVGGLIGAQQNTSPASNCSSSGFVTGVSNVGGLIGYQYNGSSAANCYSTVSVTGSGTHIGGLIGQQNSCTDSTCYSAGSVTGSNQHVGGLIGYQVSSHAVNCYSTDSVKGDSYVGGFIGYQSSSNTANCYSNGSVMGNSYTGGFIGVQSSSVATHCFWDTASSGQQSSAGGTGKSTAEMKSYLTFTGWSFKGIGSDTIWNIGHSRNSGYPYLNWQFPGDTIVTSVRTNSQDLVPRVLSLKQNYPNPFNPTTTIEFTVPEDGRVTLKIFDMLGREVAIAYDGYVKAGYLQRAVFNASRLSSGVYFSRLQYKDKSLFKKLLLLK